MNERFEKLLSQSWHECRKEQEVNDPARYYSDKGPNIDSVYEKFAELIVRECAKVIIDNEVDYPRFTGAVYDGDQAKAIMKHFGVEE